MKIVLGLFLGMFATCALKAQVEIPREKLGQTGFKFLSVTTDPRAAAMGDAATSVENNATALFGNPATMAFQQEGYSLAVNNADWIAGIQYNQAGVSFKPKGNKGVFGVHFLSVNYGSDFQGTIRDATNPLGYQDTGTFSVSAMAVGVSYAKNITDQFAIGGNVKLANQDLGTSILDFGEGHTATNPVYETQNYRKTVPVFDFGLLYKTGFKSLNFAFSMRNFAKSVKFGDEPFQLPLTAKMGISMDLMDFKPSDSGHKLLLSVDAETPRDYKEQIKTGLEYSFKNALYVRAGYSYPSDQQRLSLGVGFKQKMGDKRNIGADYSFTQFGIFSNVHRVGINMSF